MFSSRIRLDDDDLAPSPLHRALESRRAAGQRVIDLTVSNPTAVALPGEAERRAALGRIMFGAAKARYEPTPYGLRSARVAVSEYYAVGHGVTISPEHIVLTASTSESYGFLFKLLCDPGDEVLIPRPSYPLFEHLAMLDAVEVRAYPELSVPEFGPRTRAVIAVSPQNPTGATLGQADLAALDAAAADAGAAMIGDEVFADYIHNAALVAARASVLTAEHALGFGLGGLSKAAGLPQLKLGWIALAGPMQLRARALARLELIADTYLSVNTPIQAALPAILAPGGIAAQTRAAIHSRVAENRRALRQAQSAGLAVKLPLAGWYGIIRLPPAVDDEATAIALVSDEGVRVFPGYFFDIAPDEHGCECLVISLLVPPADFTAGLARIGNHLHR